MTLDEAIRHAEEVANQLEESAMRLDMTAEQAGCYSCAKEHRQLAEWLKELKRFKENGGWIPTAERLPEMHKEDGLLEKFVKERSDKVLVTIKDNNNGSFIVRSGCELWDGKWHGDIFEWLDASKCNYTVTAWMPLPEPYKESEEER